MLAAVALGRPNSEIAAELHITLSTVKTHVASLMAKLGARNRVEIAHVGVRDGPGPAGSVVRVHCGRRRPRDESGSYFGTGRDRTCCR